MDIKARVHAMKETAPLLADAPEGQRNQALLRAADMLEKQAEGIFAANAIDLSLAQDLPRAVQKRLSFDEAKLKDVCVGLRSLAGLPDPLGRQTLHRQLDEGLVLTRVSVPIGVIGVIFEARPDALVQIAGLCIKSGNCAVLKGGSETMETNRALFRLMESAARSAGLPEGCLLQADARSQVEELLSCDEDVDLLIPRGSNTFVRYIMDHTRIPVMGHADGICHTYVHAACDPAKVIPVLLDAKLQYAAACNATETVLLDAALDDTLVTAIAGALSAAGVSMHAESALAQRLSACGHEILPLDERGYGAEFLGPALTLCEVADVKAAVSHINRYGSHHTDAILTEDEEVASYFLRMVDSAGVYQNCSTRFADGFRYGFGAEVGISTGKLHARGPVGLEGLVTAKYLLRGEGQIVGDYAAGVRRFSFKDLP